MPLTLPPGLPGNLHSTSATSLQDLPRDTLDKILTPMNLQELKRFKSAIPKEDSFITLREAVTSAIDYSKFKNAVDEGRLSVQQLKEGLFRDSAPADRHRLIVTHYDNDIKNAFQKGSYDKFLDELSTSDETEQNSVQVIAKDRKEVMVQLIKEIKAGGQDEKLLTGALTGNAYRPVILAVAERAIEKVESGDYDDAIRNDPNFEYKLNNTGFSIAVNNRRDTF
jgi:hypothetical protein